jgi:hypothetical protein
MRRADAVTVKSDREGYCAVAEIPVLLRRPPKKRVSRSDPPRIPTTDASMRRATHPSASPTVCSARYSRPKRGIIAFVEKRPGGALDNDECLCERLAESGVRAARSGARDILRKTRHHWAPRVLCHAADRAIPGRVKCAPSFAHGERHSALARKRAITLSAALGRALEHGA